MTQSPAEAQKDQPATNNQDEKNEERANDLDLEHMAHHLAESQAISYQAGRQPSLVKALDRYQSLFQEAYQVFHSATDQDLTLSYAAEWILDNYYVAQQALRQISEDLPPKYYQELPKLSGGPLEGYPRVYAMARELIIQENVYLDMDRVEKFSRAYQAVAPLTMGELWALPIMLRMGILQCLILAAGRISRILQNKRTVPLLDIDLSPRLSDDEVVANSFVSLRMLAAQDWKAFFESQSLVEQILRQDPAGIYSKMDFQTRDRYRKVVERIARWTAKEELGVARGVVAAAQHALGDLEHSQPQSTVLSHSRIGSGAELLKPRATHVGYYLLDRGRTQLQRELGFRPPPHVRLKEWLFSHAAFFFLGSIFILTTFIELLLGAYVKQSAGTWVEAIVTLLLGLIPALTIAVNLVNWVVTNSVAPHVLPKMDFQAGIPAKECATIVVIPALLTQSEVVKSLLQQLEIHYLRNPDPQLSFGLLTDFADAPQADLPEDQTLLDLAIAGVKALNVKYAPSVQDGERTNTEAQGPFYLFHRKRQWNASEGLWIGWERKRGKLHQLNRLIMYGEEASFSDIEGDRHRLPDIRYVITLDADTILPLESAIRLVATLVHPLNRAEFGPQGRVIAGYTVLQPRTEINPASGIQSLFTRVFAGDRGLDLYTLAVSDVYQDLFGEGIYVGKGIYEITSFERSLEGKVPENALLSHDLFEGIYGRAGLVTDIILIEDYPPNYLAFVGRNHRWVRGDWQLIPWLFRHVPSASGDKIPNRLSVINRWKIFDNLRRSLLSPILLFLFIAGWFWLPGSALLWTLFGALSLAVPVFTGVLSEGIRWVLPGLKALFQVASIHGEESAFELRSMLRETGRSIWNSIIRWLLALAFLPYEAQLDLDAIITTLLRLLVTRKEMLRWTTAAESVRKLGNRLNYLRIRQQMIIALLIGLALIVLIIFFNPGALAVSAPLLALWIFSPEIAYWISRPILHLPESLSGDQSQQLRTLALRTWLFFEQFIGPDDHWLPPDHYQEVPLGVVAHRTSPTNIGLALLSNLAAFEMGYTGILNLIARLEASFETLEGLERYRGHFINWYDTRNLEPLTPRYVSTVDSGNLAASFIALNQGLQGISSTQIITWRTLEGIIDISSLLLELLNSFENKGTSPAAAELREHVEWIRQQICSTEGKPENWYALLQTLTGKGWNELDRLLLALVETSAQLIGPEDLRRLRIYSRQLRSRLDNVNREINLLIPWFLFLQQPPALFSQADLTPAVDEAWQALIASLPVNIQLDQIDEVSKAGRACLAQLANALGDASNEMISEAREWCNIQDRRLESAGMTAKVIQIGSQELQRQAVDYVQGMDFTFLFDPQRQVFHIGYNLALGRLDNNYYDLLASEARIASLIAIAKGDVPQSHWLHLSRPLTEVEGIQALLSWSATMFEYLMPSLLLYSYDGTLLHQTEQAVVEHQIVYAQEKNVPWGISESGYYRFDANLAYQYRAFGVPGLGYKRGLAEDLVIAPYASLLALSLRPQAVYKNLTDLQKLNMLGTFGLFEAIDFTPTRLSLGDRYEIVQEYMAHHQGMILLSLVNYFKQNLMVNLFHADPHIQSVELLLQEKIPQNAPLEKLQDENERNILPAQSQQTVTTPWRVRVLAPQPKVHFLSNGRYGLLITNSGGGFSRWRNVDLTRWRADTTLNDWGTWIYVQDQETGAFWSAGYQPTGVTPSSRDIFFNAHMAEFKRQDQDISLSMEITIPPDDDLEIRRLTITNHSEHSRRLRLISYGEVVMAEQAADQRHPAFNKLFIESEWVPEVNSLVFRRRPRSDAEEPLFLAHTVVTANGLNLSNRHESNRLFFLGRGHDARQPITLIRKDTLSNSTGATLDPVFAIEQIVELKPHASAKLAFITMVADSRQAVLALSTRYRSWHLIERAFEHARSQAEVELRHLGLTTGQLAQIEQVLSALLFPQPGLRPQPNVLEANQKGQPSLWGYSISGDYPILLVKLHNADQTSLAHELLQAHTYWRNRQLQIDLVFLNEQGTDYGQELINQLHRLIARLNSDSWINRRGGIFLLTADQMNDQDRILLETVARVILDGDKGSLAEQLQNLGRLPTRLPLFFSTREEQAQIEPTPILARPTGLLFDNEYGGFSGDGKEYIIYLRPNDWTPLPWINVIANPDFGCLVSEAGMNSTWSINSGENRLTPWNNDPVSDPPGEALYLRDEETAEVWSPTPIPARAPASYLVRHGAGYTIFEHNSHGLKQRLRIFVAPDAPVKIIQLRLENTWSRPRRITATYYAAWVLGVNREASQQFIIPDFDADSQALLAHNPYNVEFGERVAFAAANKKLHGLTADRTEFLGRMGSSAHPTALGRIGLASTIEAGIDPCAALMLHIDLQPGEIEEVYFLLGEGADRTEALNLVHHYQVEEQVVAAWQSVGKFWDNLLDTICVQTPDPAMDLMLNRWLLYQDLACRIWARSAFYQSSGAYGFRDQLQDVMAVIFTHPGLAREQILRAARHQFEAGDVLHWWHPPSGRGVRTRFSDDLLWLPFVTAYYVQVTGDIQILDEKLPFLKGAPLDEGQEERYGQFQSTLEEYSLFEHSRRALEKGATSGPHHLPLMKSGDWNDGMNRVGDEGRGESIWLAWFLYDTLMRFARLCDEKGEAAQADVYRHQADHYRQSLEASAWDGAWYLRAFYDDGSPLGSSQNRECQIDSIAQSWAVLSKAGDSQRNIQAMRSVSERLVRTEDQLFLLFTPPFDRTPRDPGYIKGYLPGIRENGGQYTHAALWSVWAFAELGQGDYAEELFRMLNPIYHANQPAKLERYKVEPYVVAADIYSVPPHVGRGGWTWYTGSAGWMYRLGVEAILGLHQEGDFLLVNPCIPKHWSKYQMTYRQNGTRFSIQVENPEGVNRGIREIKLDGKVIADGKIPLIQDGEEHTVWVILG